MKSELSTLEIKVLMEEMQFLIGARIDRIFNPGKSELIIQLHSKEGKKLLRITKNFFYIVSEKAESPSSPSEFCKLLRKFLENKRVKEIRQQESERIVMVSTESHSLIFELFGQANTVLCDRDNVVIAVSRVQPTGRVIKPREKYELPEKKKNIFEINEKEFIQLVKNSEKEIVKTLAFSIGGLYAEEICLRAGMQKNKKNLNDSEIRKIFFEFSLLVKEKIMPFVVYENSEISNAVPFDLKIYENFTKVAFSYFYEAIDFALRETEGKASRGETDKRYAKQIEKIQDIIDAQKKTVEHINKEYEENKRAGELVYENYGQIKEVMEALKEARKKMPIKDIQSKIKNKKIISIENSKLVMEL